MTSLIKKVNHTLNSFILNFSFTGVILFMLGILVLIDESTFALRVIVGAVIILIAASFFLAAFKVWGVKREVDKLN